MIEVQMGIYDDIHFVRPDPCDGKGCGQQLLRAVDRAHLQSNLLPMPVSTTTVCRPSRITSVFVPSKMRFCASGAARLSQSVLGTTPNIAPPSRRSNHR